nr:GDP-fucose protein O-fucosyltransferase 2-like [Procambarus clarkii]XP_045622998.1 GDP-fucose protein O-fucosyltransferase 2-like [Procambarus clarkii]XP_045622999.1 GDP-fucose protein O-fucosyltransferase 2-like [Procambarus clarkii]XP_045623000.1 GDP-fucose protein O-fucosyltransferase 2-like [Procambarus clarkii]XP_045623001.1 GDP-fucose protein O-fucosyltransferase 2-like [Procambarus clarkii]
MIVNMGKTNKALLLILVFFINQTVICMQDTCDKGEQKSKRYLLYDVNPGEGFNLRRDVYIRIANLVRKLNDADNWVLILPPWGNLYHWQRVQRGVYVPWKNFFDIESLSKWIPVAEFSDYLKDEGPRVGSVYVLQHYAEGWEGKWEEKYDKRKCIDKHNFEYRGGDDGSWVGQVWGTKIQTENFTCLSIQGQASTLVPLVTQDLKRRSVFIVRAETILHDEYGGKWYWNARRSMRFAHHLREEAASFRRKYLNSEDVQDKTVVKEDWRDTQPKRGVAVGGPYIAAHLRRRDFVHARHDEVPSLKKAAQQIKELLKKENLTTVFIATDASLEEFQELESFLPGYKVVRYEPSPDFFHKWGDGGVAVVDQIISSHARYFTGSYESTFSFRIQEEREILGFQERTTFNRLCGKKKSCEQPAKWRITY